MDPRKFAIATPAIRIEAEALVSRALGALADIHRLDDTLYERFVSSRVAQQEPGVLAANLRQVWVDTFTSLERVLAHVRTLAASRKPAPGASSAAADDFDFGDFEAAPIALVDERLDLQAGDIGDLVANLGGQASGSDEVERWSKAVDAVVAVHYGLESMYRQATARKEAALERGQAGTVLSLLDDVTSSANEGLHALVVAVYGAFEPDADRESLVPEYLTTLKRALKVRAGVANLAARLNPLNDILQGGEAERHPEALAGASGAVRVFVSSDVWKAMRAADRWELKQFDQQLREASPRSARQICEGLVKYLESLGSINRREVLIQHDARILGELRETAANAQELMRVSPNTTHQLLVKACQVARALRGRRQTLDELLDELPPAGSESFPAARDPEVLAQLEAIVVAAG